MRPTTAAQPTVPFVGAEVRRERSSTTRIQSDTLRDMDGGLLERARTEAGLTRQELARRAGTSRPTLSAYEHGHKSPRLDTVERILDEAGFALAVEPRVAFRQITTRSHRVASIPDRLSRLPLAQALARV